MLWVCMGLNRAGRLCRSGRVYLEEYCARVKTGPNLFFQTKSNNVSPIRVITTKYLRIYRDIHNMRKVEFEDKDFVLREQVELIYEKTITPFGNSAKIDAPKKYRGWRAYVIIVKD
jgi:putative transposon-encoded protein